MFPRVAFEYGQISWASLSKRLELVLVGTGERQLDVGLQREARRVLVERHGAGDLGGLTIETVLLGEQQDCLTEAGRPTEREQLLGVVSFAGTAEILRQSHRERELGLVEDSPPVPAAFCRPCRRIGHTGLVVLEGVGARDDFDELFGDHGLTRAVVPERQLVDHLAGVARR